MTNEYQDILHFVENNSCEVIARNWGKEVRKLKEKVKHLEQEIQSIHEDIAGEDI